MSKVPNTFIKPSKIHGLGLFAKADILKGQRIIQGYADFDNYWKEWQAYVKKWKLKSFAYNNGYCMVNHSDTPNTKRNKARNIIAEKNLKAGEEITENYLVLPDNENPFVNFLEESFYHYKNAR